MERQSVESQKGEIEFRKKLVRQQIDGTRVFLDEFDAPGVEKILRERMEKTSEQMARLKDRGWALSPYVEIGAERCQRSLVLENDFEATGAAVDISYDMLKSCDYYKGVFGKSKVPLRLCCDANHLPFLADSIPFVFCFEILHHFPDPSPVVKEIHRVLSPGGHFFFDEEPYKKVLHVNFYQGKKIYSKERLGAGKIRKIFDYFFSRTSCNEVEFDIVENHEIPVGVWKRALTPFEEKNVTLTSALNMNSALFHPTSAPKFLLTYLLGGRISGTCRKAGNPVERKISVQDVLICPSCMENGHESRLEPKEGSLFCRACGNEFPVVEDIVFLFPPRKLKELYPEVAHKAAQRIK